MATANGIAYLEEVIRSNVDNMALNILLLFSAKRGSAEQVKYLLTKGVSADIQCSDATDCLFGWTALAHAAFHGKQETASILLNSGANVLQEAADSSGQPRAASSLWNYSQKLRKTLTRIECKERVKRGKVQAQGVPLLIFCTPFRRVSEKVLTVCRTPGDEPKLLAAWPGLSVSCLVGGVVGFCRSCLRDIILFRGRVPQAGFWGAQDGIAPSLLFLRSFHGTAGVATKTVLGDFNLYLLQSWIGVLTSATTAFHS
jgi:hypothetical protein